VWGYQQAVDNLEALVVQWVFELTKANISQTGIFKSSLFVSMQVFD